jgi:hypothetical protein
MMRIFSIFLLCAISSCSGTTTKVSVIDRRDKLLDDYFVLLDSTRFLDTLSEEYRMFVAYTKNDTNYMKYIVGVLQSIYNENSVHYGPESCFQPPEISSYRVEEVYRFEYSAAFCNQSVDITLGIRSDSIFLYGVRYTFDHMSDSCLSVDSVKSHITREEWNEVKLRMHRADLWGLKEHDYATSTDGSSLRVSSFRPPLNAFKGRYTKVIRRSSEKTALGEGLKYVLKLAKYNISCFPN